MKGIYIVQRHAQLIWQKQKILIVKKRALPGSYLRRPVYFLDQNFVYGIIEVKYPKIIDLREFEKLADEHFITDSERRRWWGDAQQFFAYRFKVIRLFKNPKKYKFQRGYQNLVKNVEFLKAKK